MSLKSLREEANLKQSDVANELGVTQSAVSQWESGKDYPRANLLLDMARIFHCTVDNILLDMMEEQSAPKTK